MKPKGDTAPAGFRDKVRHPQFYGAPSPASSPKQGRPVSDDLNEAGVVQAGYGFRLPLEPLPGFGIGGESRRQDFNGDRAVEAGVSRPLPLAHSARAELGQDFVRSEFRAGGQCHHFPVGTFCLSSSNQFWTRTILMGACRLFLPEIMRNLPSGATS
jgi:hypothetical protein